MCLRVNLLAQQHLRITINGERGEAPKFNKNPTLI